MRQKAASSLTLQQCPKIQTDPSPSNLRAIRCYEKAGFERQGTVTTPDGPAVYMVQTR
ncbi:GNAT family N-acetyltransferase, partial [Klebsiella oxytoca]